jgi:hypothetical protein
MATGNEMKRPTSWDQLGGTVAEVTAGKGSQDTAAMWKELESLIHKATEPDQADVEPEPSAVAQTLALVKENPGTATVIGLLFAGLTFKAIRG